MVIFSSQRQHTCMLKLLRAAFTTPLNIAKLLHAVMHVCITPALQKR